MYKFIFEKKKKITNGITLILVILLIIYFDLQRTFFERKHIRIQKKNVRTSQKNKILKSNKNNTFDDIVILQKK